MGEKNKFSIILLVIIAALAIALASITVYVLVGGGSSTKQAEKTVQVTKPADSELTSLAVFDQEVMNLKIGDDKKSSVIQVSASIVYYNKVTGIKDTAAKVKAYDSEIKELMITYFQGLSLEDVKKPETKEKAKKDLAKQINDLLNANEKSKNDIVYTVNFSKWFYQ